MREWISHRLRRRRPPKSGTSAARQRADGSDRELWVGRERELRLFTEILDRLSGGDGTAASGRARVLFDVVGQPGFGKETLLRRYESLARDADVRTALAVQVEGAIPSLMGWVAAELAEQDESLRRFAERYQDYRRIMVRLEGAPKASEGLPALVAFGARVGVRAGRHLPGLGIAAEVISEDAAAAAASEAARWAAEHISNRDELELVTNPVPTLTHLFLEDLGKSTERRPVALFLDVTETAHEAVGRWLLRTVAEDYGALPDRLLIVLAGVRSLPRNEWIDFEDRVQRIELGPFSEEEAREYLSDVGVTDPAVVDEILRRSGRVPFVLAMLAAGRPTDPAQVSDVTGDAVAGFLASVGDAALRRLAIEASAPRVLDMDVLAALLDKADAREDFDWLSRQPFLEDRPEGRVMKEAVRLQLVKRSRRDAPASWRRVHERLATYYERLQGELELDPADAWRDETWRRYELEATFHRLCRAPRAELNDALQGFATAFGAGRRFARRMAETIAQAGLDAEASEVRECGERLVDGLDALDSEEWDAARPVFTELIESGHLEEPERARALDWRGYLSMRAGRAEEALRDLGTAIEIEPDSVEYRIDRATALSSLGRFEEAIEDFGHAVAVDPSNGRALLGMSAAKHLLGRTVDALADVQRAAEVAPEDETVWGLQGEILQVLDREEEALASLDRAVELAPESPSVLAARARLRLGRQDATGALEDLDRALALKPDDVGLEWLRVLALARAGDVAEATARTSDLARRSESLLDAIRELAEMPPAVFESQARLASRLTGIPLRQIVRDRQLAELDRDTAVELLRAQSDVRERVAAGDVTGALARYDEAVTLIPTLAQLYAGRADIHIRLDDLDAADADLQRALELSPDDVDVLAARSRLRLSQGRPQDAVVDIDRAIELDRDDYLLRSVRFIAQNMLGDFLGAAEVADFLAQHAEEYVRQMRTRLASRLLAADPAGLDAAGEATVRRVFVEGGESAAVALVKAAAAEAQARVKRVEGDLEGALGSWSEALELAPDQPSAYSERAEIERLLGRHTEALADLERAIELGGETAPVRGTRGQVLRALGRREDALADLERALAEDPSLVWARRERAQLLVEVNRPEEALTEIDRVIELEPDNYIAYSFRLGLVQALGDFQGVVDTYAVLAEHAEEYVQQSRAQIPLSAIEAAPDAASAANLRAILEGDEAAAARLVRAEAAAARAQLQSSQGDLEGAVAGWNEALSLAPHLVIGYLTRADLQRLLDRPAEALADFDRAIELGAEGAPVRLARGVVLGAQGRTEEALTDLERALAEDPSLTAARVERADILLGDDRAEDALAEIERAIQAGDDTPVVRGTRGQALRALERRDEALADLDRALDADPSLNWARIERAGILLDERRSEEALHDLEILLEPNPDAAAPLIFRAIAKAQLRRYAEALADYERVAELVPGAGGFEADRAELLLLLGRPDEALRLSAGALAQVEEGEPEEIWLRYVHALARRALDEPDADEELRRLAREAESRAAEEHAEPHRLVQGALFRLAAGDEEEAERILQEAAREDDGLSPALARDVAADLETLSEILPEQAGAARRLAADLLSHA